MMKVKGNSGAEKSPKPKSKSMFSGIKGLVSSGAGMTKMPDTHKIRPEGSVKIDAGNVKAASGGAKTASGSPKMITGSGHKGVHMGVRAMASVKRDSASVVKP